MPQALRAFAMTVKLKVIARKRTLSERRGNPTTAISWFGNEIKIKEYKMIKIKQTIAVLSIVLGTAGLTNLFFY